MTLPWTSVGDQIQLAFPTPIYKTRLPDTDAINQALLEMVLERERQEPSTARSNVGGWQSSHDLLSWPAPEIAHLKKWINDAFGEVMKVAAGPAPFNCRLAVTAWANINRRGDYNRGHTHSANHWSGVYYVAIGEAVDSRPLSGAIELLDPRPAINVFDIPGIAQLSTWTIQPEPGMLLMFPSWLRHSVLPYEGEKERVTIAFNIRVQELKRQPPGPPG